ncbi:hypothetical protein DY262_19680 [Hydrogenophaga borbori]|uniref:Uncharacterized protein n=1 Tax=Hydrogenophaga borbori TaxID=2294117 RepID=A0A372EEZ7_9BURK|nr:hypothetical protein [Hydrogenophaga borbori]RFP76885.1 hypothetical protein DY262_19680 [Hydrogenophaga borbori]
MEIEWGSRYELPPPRPELPAAWALEELADELMRLRVGGVNPRLLGVPDAFGAGGWCIHPEGPVWVVYYAEGGRRWRPSVFTSPFDAANFYLWLHLADMAPAARGAARFLGFSLSAGTPTTVP